MHVLWSLEQVSLGQRLRDVTLRIHGGVTAVLGPSGAGKTSLLNLLVGFERPDAGRLALHLPNDAHRRSPSCAGTNEVPVDGGPVYTRPIFWAPQGDGLWPHLTAREHLVYMQGADPDLLLAEFDLTSRAQARPETLSQGERARLAVARALAAEAAVLVMDEPLAHVDPMRVGKYWDLLGRRLERTGTALIFATHAPGTVLAQAQQVICLREARVVYAGAVQALYDQPASAELAECLGEFNWLEPDDARRWLQREEAVARCYRPERLAVVAAATGGLIVESARFQGAVAEVVLRHEASGEVRRFWHRPAGGDWVCGMRVKLALIEGA